MKDVQNLSERRCLFVRCGGNHADVSIWQFRTVTCEHLCDPCKSNARQSKRPSLNFVAEG